MASEATGAAQTSKMTDYRPFDKSCMFVPLARHARLKLLVWMRLLDCDAGIMIMMDNNNGANNGATSLWVG